MIEYDGLIIRPPSEAESLILQHTIGCSHNTCIFCPAYKQKRFRIRGLEEIREEVEACIPEGADVRRIFLADGDALVVPQADLIALFSFLNARFPSLRRIAQYANAKNILGKTVDELRQLREQGLGILYLGIESGDDELLAWMGKGVTSAQMEEAGKRVKEAGIKLSVTVLLGIGGRKRSAAHARATGRLLSAIEPDYVGALTTMVVPGTPLHDLEQAGQFALPPVFEILSELADMLENTRMNQGLFFANHASNYLPLRLRMPADRDQAIATIRDVVKREDPSVLRPASHRRL